MEQRQRPPLYITEKWREKKKRKADEHIRRFYGTYYDAWTLDDPQSRDWKIKARTLRLFVSFVISFSLLLYSIYQSFHVLCLR